MSGLRAIVCAGSSQSCRSDVASDRDEYKLSLCLLLATGLFVVGLSSIRVGLNSFRELWRYRWRCVRSDHTPREVDEDAEIDAGADAIPTHIGISVTMAIRPAMRTGDDGDPDRIEPNGDEDQPQRNPPKTMSAKPATRDATIHTASQIA